MEENFLPPYLDCSLSCDYVLQEFLNDYGMLWVGKEGGENGREDGDLGEQCPGQLTGKLWNPEASVAGDPKPSSTVNFDAIVKNVKVCLRVALFYCTVLYVYSLLSLQQLSLHVPVLWLLESLPSILVLLLCVGL